MKIYVARHGQTQWNLLDRVCGREDIPMNDTGFEQARALAEKVSEMDIDLMFSSPLTRAIQTTETVAERCHIPWFTDERLIEFNFGIFDGSLRTDPKFHALRRNMAYRFPGGESSFDVAARIYNFIDEVRVKYAGKNLLLITHGALARALRTYFVNMTNEEYLSYNTENCKCVEYDIPDINLS